MSQEYEMKRPGLNRGSSLFGPDPQTQLLNAVRQQDLRIFKKVLQSDNVDPEHFYEYPDYKTCLDIACCNSGTAEFIKLLLEAKVDINKINETHRKAPIHFAAETGDVDCVKALLENTHLNIDLLSKSNTALQLAVKKVKTASKDTVSRYEDVVIALLKHGIDANIPDMKNSTAILFAAKSRLERVVRLILEHSKRLVDLDSYEDAISQKTARAYIEDHFPQLLENIPQKGDLIEEEKPIDKNKLFALLNAHDEGEFITALNSIDKTELPKIINDNNGYFTMLQMCSDSGLDKAVEVLLKNGADPNKMAPGSNGSPIALACSNGYHKILRLLSESDSTSFEPINGDSLLQIAIKESKHKEDDPKTDYEECRKILMDNPRVDTNINYIDIKGNTALHYAARSGDHETVLSLLEKGACVGLRNVFNEPPLADISAKTLEAYLDNCLTTNGERPNDEDYEILFNYSFLVPPCPNPQGETKVPLMDNSDVSQSANDKFLAPETDALLYMTRSAELRPLLKHPVITSFLFLKWQRISCLFYANISFYALFWVSLILYILLGYAEAEDKSETKQTIGDITHVTTVIGWIILTLREISQMFVTPTRYLKSFENWLEISLIIVTALIIFNDSAREETKQQLSAIGILLSSAELVLLIGQFPTLSTNIVMLKTVSWNFFKFLLWYCILIIAFALSFYTLFKSSNNKNDPNNETIPFDPNKPMASEDDEPNFFTDPGISLFKTIVMLTGEFDASSINFESFPVTSHIIFVIFVFMIPIVLFNLLNGLAVSDTQAIKENAELVGHISRIKLISYFESVVLGDMSPYKNAVSNVQSACCWLPGKNCIKSRVLLIKPLARRICLFPNYLPNAQIGVKTNQSSKVVIHTCDRMKKKQERNDDDNPDITLCCFRRCNETIMDRKVVKAARLLIAERDDGGSELNQIKQRLVNVEKILEQILNRIEKT